MQDLELEKYRPLFDISGALAGKRKVTLHKPALIVPAGSNRYSLKEKELGQYSLHRRIRSKNNRFRGCINKETIQCSLI